MSGSPEKIEGAKVANALEQDQQEQRAEDEAAMQRERRLSDRLASELSKRSAP